MTTFLQSFGLTLLGLSLLAIWFRPCGTDLHLTGYVGYTIAMVNAVAWNVLSADWPWVPAFAAFAVYGAWRVRKHWRDRKRKRTLAMLGAKSRALRDALVRRMRHATRPRPVLKPQPQGM